MASAAYRPEVVAEPRTVLLVEDEALLRMLMAELLRGAGLRVIEAATADEAVAVLDAGLHLDMVFTDVRMPGRMDGVGLALTVRRDRPEVAVLVTSGDLAPDIARQMPAFIPKPYDLDAVVVQILDRLDAPVPE
ncbi:response regulator [Azorhizobium sp. AG788]|uniref:response regulator n=1 Tax=Azorhizobium sp. AG788 TaxID=2183897 RepID=UPI0031399474